MYLDSYVDMISYEHHISTKEGRSMQGLTKHEIKEKIPELKMGSFDLFAAKAGVKKVGIRPNKKRPHLYENIYPLKSIEKIKKIMIKKEGK
jgi:hypothetical protein